MVYCDNNNAPIPLRSTSQQIYNDVVLLAILDPESNSSSNGGFSSCCSLAASAMGSPQHHSGPQKETMMMGLRDCGYGEIFCCGVACVWLFYDFTKPSCPLEARWMFLGFSIQRCFFFLYVKGGRLIGIKIGWLDFVCRWGNGFSFSFFWLCLF